MWEAGWIERWCDSTPLSPCAKRGGRVDVSASGLLRASAWAQEIRRVGEAIAQGDLDLTRHLWL